MAYTIDGIQQSYDLTSNGTRRDVLRISFVTDAGDNGSVTVDLAGDAMDVANKLIADQVAMYDAIRAAGGA